jgi:hypothetical protein
MKVTNKEAKININIFIEDPFSSHEDPSPHEGRSFLKCFL